MTYIRNSTVVGEFIKVRNDCSKLKDDFVQIIQNVRNKDDVEIVRKHILLMFDELLMNEVKEKIEDMERDNSSKETVKPYSSNKHSLISKIINKIQK